MILIDKPQDWTSFDVCGKLRGALKIKKASTSLLPPRTRVTKPALLATAQKYIKALSSMYNKIPHVSCMFAFASCMSSGQRDRGNCSGSCSGFSWAIAFIRQHNLAACGWWGVVMMMPFPNVAGGACRHAGPHGDRPAHHLHRPRHQADRQLCGHGESLHRHLAAGTGHSLL